MIDTFLFDMDGVITNTEDFHFESWRLAFLKVGHVLTKDSYLINLQSRDRTIGILSELPNINSEMVQLISEAKTLCYEQFLNQGIEVFEDTIQLLKRLKRDGFSLAVVSSSSKAKEIISKIDCSSYFDLIIGGTKELNIRNKPYPDSYIHAMKLLNKLPSQCVVVEDSLSGATAGLQSLATVIFVNRGNQRVQVDPSVKVVKSLDYDIIKNLITIDK